MQIVYTIKGEKEKRNGYGKKNKSNDIRHQ